jgi:hypothetical protein
MPENEQPPVVDAELVEEEEETESAIAVARPAVIEAQERAATDVMITQALRKPRQEDAVIKQRMISAVSNDVETAEDCFYTLKRKDKKTGKETLIQGPSVRLAQIALKYYGHIRAGSRVVENDGRKVTAQGFCYDVENNVFIQTEVSRRITTRSGRTFSEDMQIVTANAACAIARRNAIFEVIPRTLINPVYEAARKTAVGEAKTLDQKRQTVLGRFGAMGVTRAQILTALGKETIEAIDLEALEILIGLGTAIKDGQMTVDEVFLQAPAELEPETKTRLKDLARQAAEAKAEAKKKEPRK